MCVSEFLFGVQFFFITHIFFVVVVVVETTLCPIFIVSSSLVLVSFSHCPIFFLLISQSRHAGTRICLGCNCFFGNCKCVREFGSSYSLYSSAFHFVKHQTYFAFFLHSRMWKYICSRASLCVCEHICLILKCVWLCIITCLQHCTEHNKLLIAICRRSLYERGWRRRKLALEKVCMCKSTTQNKRKVRKWEMP